MTLDLVSEFGLPADRVWMNAAHQGALPKRAAQAVSEVVRWKLEPHHLQQPEAFIQLPEELRCRIAGLIAGSPEEVVLANSASYGLHLVANGLELREGDEVVVASNDFPSDILPWLRLEGEGVRVSQVSPTAGSVPTPSEISESLTERTRVVCLSWVHSFSGQTVDLEDMGALCRERDVLFVVNGSQGVGSIPLSVQDVPIDVLVSVGFKWLCGPYGTGFCWLGPRAMEQLRPTKWYWLTSLTTKELEGNHPTTGYSLPEGSRAYDIFGTANFFNFAGLSASLSLISEIGLLDIRAHNRALIERLEEGLDPDRYQVTFREGSTESSIVFLRPNRETVPHTADKLRRGRVDVAVRSGLIRVSPHMYNTQEDVDRLLDVLESHG